jgi:hypothetical protein
MRHQYDRDGMIPYAGAVRASRRWQSSNYKVARVRTTEPRRESQKAQEVALDTMTHHERVAAILASSKYTHNFN